VRWQMPMWNLQDCGRVAMQVVVVLRRRQQASAIPGACAPLATTTTALALWRTSASLVRPRSPKVLQRYPRARSIYIYTRQQTRWIIILISSVFATHKRLSHRYTHPEVPRNGFTATERSYHAGRRYPGIFIPSPNNLLNAVLRFPRARPATRTRSGASMAPRCNGSHDGPRLRQSAPSHQT
jgi:hypothetical protein